MIGKIKGTLTEIYGNRGYVETPSGVTYLVYCVPSYLDKLHKEVEIYTHLQVKDDDLVLFGFESHSQHRLFQMLIGVDGVGPKLGFTIVSYSVENLIVSAVESADVNFFQSIPGVGKKTAQRVILELSGKLAKQIGVESMISSSDDMTVIEALQSLGFKDNDIRKSLSGVDKNAGLEEKIRQAIQSLSKS